MRKRMMSLAMGIACMALMMAPPILAQTPAPKPLTPQQQRMKDCGAEWQTMKKEGKTKGLTWAAFRKDCLKKK
jgi:hypothetical protein